MSSRASELETILDPATIRARTRRVLDAALAGGTAFAVHEGRLADAVDLVLDVTRRNYPDGNIPVHGRFEHLRAGGVDRVAAIRTEIADRRGREAARALIDLVVVSVLLDAGAGDAWGYDEGGVRYARSEGLAVASAAMFREGAFSGDAHDPLRVTASGLERLDVDAIRRGFQVSEGNPIAGLEGRAGLVRRLAGALRAHPELFGEGDPRPGNLFDALAREATGHTVEARTILRALLVGLSRIWPARVICEDVGFGDVWSWGGGGFEHWIPFHKLSQWLTYSLIEPFEIGGVAVTGLDALTGLPEYRNGGLFLDTGVLTLRDPSLAERRLSAGDSAIVEWRALTVQLLDRVGDAVRARLGKSADELPLARVLQGGTWAAGREIAKRLRVGGGPPLTLESDGMVF